MHYNTTTHNITASNHCIQLDQPNSIYTDAWSSQSHVCGWYECNCRHKLIWRI